MRGLAMRRLALRRLVVGRLRLTPAATALTWLLAPTTLSRLAALLTPLLPPWLPARLAPRLPRTPRSLWRRRHIRSLKTHV